ncbi:integrin beta-5-like [Leptonychotes weddellii]|uniref:Integrin beta-5-like n=1 Tax=Leptonychotes weddellii TaxID=9713 RepID=A0A7F8Q2L1_LEPWE|nr:integrin beta-5-like [Leptonychotes weddellii]
MSARLSAADLRRERAPASGPLPPPAFSRSSRSRAWGAGRAVGGGSPGRAPGWSGGPGRPQRNGPSLLPAQASFEVSAEARSCPGRPAEHTFTLRPVGFRDSLEVGVTYSCQCSCSAGLEPDSARCSGNGTYVCGLCECNPGHLGTRCECQEGESQSGYQNLCREAEGKPLCSGRGECSCNQCSCFESEFGKIYGAFCQCDNFSCARNKGVLCSGHGECHCGECKCHAGYIGDNCNCSTDLSTCLAKDGQICSDRGHCVCGQCRCTEPGAFGETCERCPTCPDACSTKRDCVECLLLHSGGPVENQTCHSLCKDEVVTWVDTIGECAPAALAASPFCILADTSRLPPRGDDSSAGPPGGEQGSSSLALGTTVSGSWGLRGAPQEDLEYLC